MLQNLPLEILPENIKLWQEKLCNLSAEEILQTIFATENTCKNNGNNGNNTNNANNTNNNNGIAVFSSFGSYSALLLKLVADIAPDTPVIFIDTEKHFPETLQYVEDITNLLGLTNLITLKPSAKITANIDAEGNLWNKNANRCCWLRKVEPLETHLKQASYKAVITGRRRYQTKERSAILPIEVDGNNQVKINPFFNLSKQDIEEKFAKFKLPQHPLVAKSYLSIGCAPCTFPVKQGEDERSGRWANSKQQNKNDKGDEDSQKQECGIHLI